MKKNTTKNEIAKSERTESNNENIKRTTIINSITLFTNHLHARKLAESSIQAYKADLKIFHQYLKANSYKVYVDEINKVDITNYQNYLLSTSYKMTTIDRKYDSLQQFFRFLNDFDIIKANPLQNFIFKRSKNAFDKEEDHTINFLEQMYIENIIDCARKSKSQHKYRDVALLELLKTTGCRRDTVLTLKWSDVFFDKSEIRLNHQKTNNTVRIKMASSLVTALKEHLNTSMDVTSYVFQSQKGTQLRKDAFNDLINKYATNSGVEKVVGFKITSRTFRHSFITHCIVNNIPLAKIAHITGHKDIETLKYYTHLVSKDTDEVAGLF